MFSSETHNPRMRALIFAGLVWFGVGFGYAFELNANNTVNPGLLHTTFPRIARTILWVVPGAFALLFCRSRLSNIAIALLLIAPLQRALSYFYGWILWVFDHEVGVENAWYQALFYLAIVGFVWYMAYLPTVSTPFIGKNIKIINLRR